jgi:hypothetical protein
VAIEYAHLGPGRAAFVVKLSKDRCDSSCLIFK